MYTPGSHAVTPLSRPPPSISAPPSLRPPPSISASQYNIAVDSLFGRGSLWGQSSVEAIPAAVSEGMMTISFEAAPLTAPDEYSTKGG